LKILLKKYLNNMNPALPKQNMYICKNLERLGQKSLLKKRFKKGRAG